MVPWGISPKTLMLGEAQKYETKEKIERIREAMMESAKKQIEKKKTKRTDTDAERKKLLRKFKIPGRV